MTRSLEDPTFAGRVESVDADLSYRVEFDGASTETYHVRVFEYPELERADAKLVFPAYTALEPKTVEDIRHVTAVEGTELTLCSAGSTRTSPSAQLVDEKGQAIALTRRQDGRPRLPARRSRSPIPRRYKVQLVDREGRTNKLAAEIVVERDAEPAAGGQDDPAGARRPGLAGRGAQAQGRDRRRLRPGAPWPQLHAWRARSRARSS